MACPASAAPGSCSSSSTPAGQQFNVVTRAFKANSLIFACAFVLLSLFLIVGNNLWWLIATLQKFFSRRIRVLRSTIVAPSAGGGKQATEEEEEEKAEEATVSSQKSYTEARLLALSSDSNGLMGIQSYDLSYNANYRQRLQVAPLAATEAGVSMTFFDFRRRGVGGVMVPIDELVAQDDQMDDDMEALKTFSVRTAGAPRKRGAAAAAAAAEREQQRKRLESAVERLRAEMQLRRSRATPGVDFEDAAFEARLTSLRAKRAAAAGTGDSAAATNHKLLELHTFAPVHPAPSPVVEPAPPAAMKLDDDGTEVMQAPPANDEPPPVRKGWKMEGDVAIREYDSQDAEGNDPGAGKDRSWDAK